MFHLDNPQLVAPYNDLLYIVDKQYTRMICVDKDTVTDIINLPKLHYPFDRITKVLLTDDSIYICGVNYINGSIWIEYEHIEQYTLNGKHKATIYKETVPDDQYRTMPSFSDIYIKNGHLHLVRINPSRKSLAAIDLDNSNWVTISSESEIPIASGTYDLHDDSLQYTDLQCNMFIKFKPFIPAIKLNISEYINSDPVLRAFKTFFGVDEWNLLAKCTMNKLHNEKGHPIKTYMSYYWDNGICVYDHATKDIAQYRTYKISGHVILMRDLYWICLSILLVSLFVSLLYSIPRYLRHLNRHTRHILLVAVVIAIISGFYSLNIYKNYENEFKKQISMLSTTITKILQNYHSDTFTKIRSAGVQEFCFAPENWEEINEINNLLRYITQSGGKQYGCYAYLTICDKNMVFYSLADSIGANMTGYPYRADISDHYLSMTDKGIMTYADADTVSMTDRRTIKDKYDSEEIVAALTVSYLLNNIKETAYSYSIRIFINLAALLTGIYIIQKLARNFTADIRNYKAIRPHSKSEAVANLSGISCFILYILKTIDIMFLVLIFRDICSNMPAATATAISGAALLAFTISQFAGKLSASLLRMHISEKCLGTIASLFSLVGSICCIMALRAGILIPFAIGKCILGFFSEGILSGIISDMPFKINIRAQQEKLIDSFYRSTIAAYIVGILISGYAVTYFGYEILYIICAAGGFCLLIISIKVLAGKSDGKHNNAICSIHEAIRIACKPTSVIYFMCALIPLIVIAGYCNYSFPITAKAADMSPIILANLTVLMRMFCYVVSETFCKTAHKIGSRNIILTGLISCGIVSSFFIMNHGITWAIIMLFIATVTDSFISEMFTTVYYTEQADKLGASPIIVNQVNTKFRGLGKLGQPIFVWLLPLGMNNVCTMIGIVLLICAVIFWFFTLRKKNILTSTEIYDFLPSYVKKHINSNQ
ncbi:MAG: MFS transporter [Spirochaetia bacterium]|nr:MFS transporter [Spirochaetia bacterium]